MTNDKTIKKIVTLIRERADRVAGGLLTEEEPLEFVFRGEALTARTYDRYNGTLILALEVFVDDVEETPEVFRWVATRSGVMPFATIHVDRPLVAGSAPAAVKISHSLVADEVTGRQLDEVLDGMTYMSRRARSRFFEFAEIAEAEAAASVDEAESVDAAPEPSSAKPAARDPQPAAESSARRVRPPIVDDDDVDGEFGMHSGDIVTPSKNRPQDAILRELEALVGMEPVKDEINRIIAAQRLARERRRRGLLVQEISPHLVFVGNPGTGKTTVARLVGELYRSLGLLDSGHLVEADRSTLVAAYMGQTAIKTRQVCEAALGGVLFIDEAYSLVGERDQYGEECINTLLQFMENHRGEFAVVVAGYPEEMHRFIESNPGLRARFDMFVGFPDYSDAELEEIFLGIARASDYELSDEAMARVRSYIAAWPRWRGFGNGREVRKLFGDIARRHAELLFARGDSKNVSTADLRTIKAEAVPDVPNHQAPAGGVRYGDGGYL